MKNKFLISESERERILNLHINATKKQYLSEQVSEDDLKQKFISRMNWIYVDNNTAISRFTDGQVLAQGIGYLTRSTDGSIPQIIITNLTSGSFQPGAVMTENQWKTWENTAFRDFPRITKVSKDDNGNTVLDLNKLFDTDEKVGDVSNPVTFVQGYPPFSSTRLDEERDYYQYEPQLKDLYSKASSLSTPDFVQALNDINPSYLERVEPSNNVYNSFQDYTNQTPCKPTYELYNITNLLNVVISKLIYEFEFQKSLYNRDKDVTLTQFNCND